MKITLPVFLLLGSLVGKIAAAEPKVDVEISVARDDEGTGVSTCTNDDTIFLMQEIEDALFGRRRSLLSHEEDGSHMTERELGRGPPPGCFCIRICDAYYA